MSNKIIKLPDTSLAPTQGFQNDGKGILHLEETVHYKIINVYFAYDLQSNLNYNPDFTLENCLFGRVNITKNVNIDKFKYSGYGIGFDGKGVISHPTGSFGNNAIMFGIDMSSSVHIDNKKRHFDFRKGPNRRIRRAFINCRKNVFNQF